MVSSTAVLQVLFLACVVASGESPGAETDVKRPEPASAVTAATDDDDSGQRATVASPPATQPKDVSILKQINKVNDDGSYTFGYEASDGSFKVETRDVAGNVKGMFGFVDDVGRLKRVSYSASNSSGFQAAGSESPRPSPDPTASSAVQTTTGRRNKKDDGGGDESDGGKSAVVGVKKVLVSKRPVVVAAAPELRTETENEVDDQRRRGGNDLRRQLPRNDDGDAPDVYGVHGRSSLQESGPVSPVVSALMSELMPVRSYGRPTGPPPPSPQSPPIEHEDAVSSRRAAQELQEDEYEDGQQYNGGPTTVQYRGRRPPAALYQQRASYPTVASTAAYQQQRPVAYLAPLPQRGPSLVALRDELMELILSFVQARVSQLVSIAPYPAPSPYPMPYQQPNYYVPNYYQGPRMPGPTTEQAQESSPIVTQTLKDGLIRMLLSTSPRYDPDRISERSTTRLAYRSTSTQPSPVRSVQIVSGGNDDDDRMVDSRPVTTETPD
ncbi:AT-rich interactive domain-containing protein 1A-like [Metopolophium dirhodum]|uniref:AT-rich interactive domain-containing protein 1A-like n=1 Tax=Metopolophium dirhodum TaxID=44670 RepID=UPI00298FC6B7|nr:AT-rich interactive domain-containing protein 1A-like [Metopolophium dirhodum]